MEISIGIVRNSVHKYLSFIVIFIWDGSKKVTLKI